MSKIAIVRLSSLGDVVISASVLGGLGVLLGGLSTKKEHIKIDWFVDERFGGVLQDSPHINTLHCLPFKKWLKSPLGIYKIWKYARSCEEYDTVIDMQGLLKSAFVGKCLKSKKFVGFSAKGCREGLASLFYTQKVDINYDANILVRNFLVAFSSFGVDLQRILQRIGRDDWYEGVEHLANIDNMERLEKAVMNLRGFKRVIDLRGEGFGINVAKLVDFSDTFLAYKKSLALQMINKTNAESSTNSSFSCPAEILEAKKFLFVIEASIEAKTYPIDKFRALAQMLQKYYKNIAIYVIWNDYERRADELVSLLKSRNIRAIKLPRLDFNNIKFILKNMDIVIGGDTGITHLAWAIWQPLSILLLGNNAHSSGKNMRDARLQRVLLGNPFVLSQSDEFEIASISPDVIFDCVKAHLDEE